jgi:hypothetical protein
MSPAFFAILTVLAIQPLTTNSFLDNGAKEKYKQVQIGMTMPQVERIMGSKPNRAIGGLGFLEFSWEFPQNIIWVCFPDDLSILDLPIYAGTPAPQPWLVTSKGLIERELVFSTFIKKRSVPASHYPNMR